MQRRLFLRGLVRLVWMLWVGSGLYVMYRFMRPPRAARSTGREFDAGPTDEQIPGTSRTIIAGHVPLLLIRVDEKKWVALQASCTHLRCGLHWNPQSHSIDCPCHGGQFDINGNVLTGPPPSPLHRYPIRIHDGHIYIGI